MSTMHKNLYPRLIALRDGIGREASTTLLGRTV
jgi:hypothetical protein